MVDISERVKVASGIGDVSDAAREEFDADDEVPISLE